jgi:hypothetical protein
MLEEGVGRYVGSSLISLELDDQPRTSAIAKAAKTPTPRAPTAVPANARPVGRPGSEVMPATTAAAPKANIATQIQPFSSPDSPVALTPATHAARVARPKASARLARVETAWSFMALQSVGGQLSRSFLKAFPERKGRVPDRTGNFG